MGYIQIVSCITEPSGYGSIPGERGRRNMAASIRGSAREKKVQQESGNGSEEVGGLPRTFKRAVRGGWSMKGPVGWTYTQAWLSVCVCVCCGERYKCSHTNVCSTDAPRGLKYSTAERSQCTGSKISAGAHPHRKSDIFRCLCWAWNGTED